MLTILVLPSYLPGKHESPMSSLRQDAEKILEPLKAQFRGPHDIVPVSESNFPHLDFSKYSAVDGVLRASTYAYLIDVELRDVSNNDGNIYHPTLIRQYLAKDGSTVASAYLLKPSVRKLLELFARGMRNLRWLATPALMMELAPQRMILDLESELEDGRFLVSSNAEAAAMMTAPPTIAHLFFPYQTPYQDIISAHKSRIASLAQGDTFVRLRTFDETVSMSRRQKRQKDAYRASLDWISRDEMIAMGDGRIDVSEALFNEVQALLREQGTSEEN